MAEIPLDAAIPYATLGWAATPDGGTDSTWSDVPPPPTPAG
jgi:hypothetical protein